MRLALAFLLLPTAVLAGETAWQELAPDTRIRLIASESLSPDGRTHIALELDMPSDTKTYWKVPGETGIPLELDFAGTEGLEGHRVIWPFPKIDIVSGYTDFVHYGHVVIPIELDLGAVPGARLELGTLMGICSDICVPATAAFSLPLDFGKPDAGQQIRIDQAIAEAPIAWAGEDGPIGSAVYDAAAEVLSVEVDSSRADPSSLLADASAAGYVFGAPQKSPEPNLVTFDLLGGADAAKLQGETVSFVFLTEDGPYALDRLIEPPPAP